MGPPSRGLTTCRKGQRGWVQRVLGGSRRQGPWQSNPRLQKLALGRGNVTFLMGKGLGLSEVEVGQRSHCCESCQFYKISVVIRNTFL